MKKVFIYPYSMNSMTCGYLKKSLGVKLIRREGSRFVGNQDKHVINWGSSSIPDEVRKCGSILNDPNFTRIATNKLSFFTECEKDPTINIPEFTTDVEVACSWIFDEGNKVCCRTILTGNSGAGLSVVSNMRDIPRDTKMFVKYIPKQREYRVHVFKGHIISVQEKRLRNEVNREDANWEIRNHANGFIFARENVNPPAMVTEQAIKVCNHLHLDFAALDIVYNNFRNKAYVLEANTAPGLDGTTLTEYAEAFKKYFA